MSYDDNENTASGSRRPYFDKRGPTSDRGVAVVALNDSAKLRKRKPGKRNSQKSPLRLFCEDPDEPPPPPLASKGLFSPRRRGRRSAAAAAARSARFTDCG